MSETGAGNDAPVVVGWEDSEAGARALDFAVTEAKARDVPLVVVAAYLRPVDPDLESFDETPEHQQARVREHAMRALSRLAADSSLPPARVDVREGPAWKVLCSYTDAAAIVVGEHPRFGVRKLWEWTTTGATLLRRCSVPVIVVPTPPTERHHRPERSPQRG